MIVSLQMLKNSVENYKRSKERSKENFNWSKHDLKKGVKDAFGLFILIIAIIFFIFELILLFYSIMIVFRCYQTKQERIIQFVLAITFTTPYMLVQTVFNPCAKSYIQNGMKLQQQS